MSGTLEQINGADVSKRVVRPQRAACTVGATRFTLQANGAASTQICSLALIEKQACALLALPGSPCAPIRNSCVFSSANIVAAVSNRFNKIYWMRRVVPGRTAGVPAPEQLYPSVYFVLATKPKSVVSVESSAATANTSPPQAVQSGALIPATALARTAILRSVARGRKLQNVSGTSPVRMTVACLEVESPPPPASVAFNAS